MDENIKVFSIAVPGSLPESAKEFIRSLVNPTQDPEGKLGPPPRITFDRESGLRSVYVVGDLTFRSLGIDTDGSPLATVIKAVVVPVDKKDHTIGCLTCDGSGWERWPERGLARVCPSCERCPECGGSGVGNTPGALACEDVCAKCGGKGRVRKDELGPMGMRGEVEKGPADESVTVENEDELKGEFGDCETFPSDPKKQELKRRILDRMTARDMVDAISDGCDLPNLADIIIGLFPEEEILNMTEDEPEVEEKDGVEISTHDLVIVEDLPKNDCPDCLGTGKKFIEEPDERDCEKCNGTGKVVVEDEKTELVDCPKCGGSGFGETFGGVPSYCKGCDGAGTVPTAPLPCAECDGTGTRLLDSNVQPCPKCNGRGLERPDDPDGPNPPQPCPTCNGRGRRPAQADRDAMIPPCPTCHGTGKNPDHFDTSPCPTCKGTGRTPGVGFATFGEDPCPACNGTGKIPEEDSNDGTTNEC